MRNLNGKTALVTGPASGIGRALAIALAKQGVKLHLVDVDAAGLTDVVAAAKACGTEAVGRHCDLAQPTQISQLVRELLATSDGVDILVNNAGVTYYGRTREMTSEHWNHLMAVNLNAPIQLTRELLPSLLDRNEGHVLNVASICGLVGLGRVTAYTTSKFGLVGFSESLRAEYARQGLGVTALCPGLVDTNLFDAAAHGSDRAANKTPPRWLLVSPEKIAARGVRAIRRNRGVVVMQPYARSLYAIKRFAPRALDFAHRFRRRRRAA